MFHRQVSRRRVEISSQRPSCWIKIRRLLDQAEKTIMSYILSYLHGAQKPVRKSEDSVSVPLI